MSGIQGVFGFMRSSEIAGYAYVGMTSNNRNAVTQAASFGTAPPGPFLPLATQPSSGTLNGVIGIVADGGFICTTGNYSLDNGVTWAQLTGSGTQKYFPPGVNGCIAYSTTSKRAFTIALGPFGKTSDIGCAPITITKTGNIIGSTSFVIGASAQTISNVTYSPAFNYFYVNAFTNSANTYRYIDAASPATGTNVTLGTPSHYRPGISDDGYPLIPINTGGSNFDLRKYTSSDLSTYTSYGTVSDAYFGQSTKSPWLWFPINNKYIIAAVLSNNVNILTATSGSPQSLSFIGSFNNGQASSVFCVSVSEDATGKLICSGIAQYAEPKGGFSIANFCFFSSDGGVGWTNYLQTVLGASKNFK